MTAAGYCYAYRMARTRELTTARARRALDPIVWTIDGIPIHLRDDIIVTDLVELADVLTGAGVNSETAQADPMAVLRATNKLVDDIVITIAPLVVESDREDWQRLARALDPMNLVGLVYDIIEEVSGKNPSLPSGSSEASRPGGEPSTAGAQPEGSTPSFSPPTVA